MTEPAMSTGPSSATNGSSSARGTDPTAGTADNGAPKAPSLLRSSAIMASGTMVSRMLGLVRTVMLLAAIGTAAGGVSAAFQTANTLPNTVYNLLAAGVFDAVLVPQIVKFLKQKSGDVAVNRLITLAGTILFLVTVVALVISPLLVTMTAAAYTGQMRALTIAFSLLCLPQIFFYGLYNLLGELLNARGVFGPYMWAPVVNNVIAIAGLAVFISLWGTNSSVRSVGSFTTTQFWVLAGSATLGVVCQAAVLVLPMRRAGIHLRPDFHFRGTSFGSASKVAGWTFATLGISQLGVLSTNNLAAQADAWALLHPETLIAGNAAYTTAFMIYMVPQSVISVSLATAIFTRLANAAADRDHRVVATNYHLGVQLITMLSLLCAAILIAAAFPMMQIVAFRSSLEIIPAYAWVLVALMPGVASTGMVLMSQRVFFAYEDAKPVFLMGIVPTILQVIVGWSVFFLASPRWWVVGAALGETVCRLVQGFIAVIWVARKNHWVNPGRIIASYLKYFVAALVALGVGLICITLVGPVSDFDSRLVRVLVSFLKLLLISVVVTASYVGALRIIDPEGSGRILSSIATRLHLTAFLSRLMVRRPASGLADGDNGATTDGSGTGGAMVRGTDDELGEPDGTLNDEEPTDDEREESEEATRTGWTMIARSWSASDPTHTGEFPAVRLLGSGAEKSARLPTFDEILHPGSASSGSTADDSTDEDEADVSPDEASTSDVDALTASGDATARLAATEDEDASPAFPPPPTEDDLPAPAEAPEDESSNTATDSEPPEPPLPTDEDTADSSGTESTSNTDTEQWIPTPAEHLAPAETWSEALHGEHEREIRSWREHSPSSEDEAAGTTPTSTDRKTAIPPTPEQLGPADTTEWVPGASSASSLPPTTSSGSGSSTPTEPHPDRVADTSYPSDGHKFLNPTIPAVILGVLLVVFGGAWALRTVFSPLSADPFSELGGSSSSASPSQSEESSTAASPSGEAAQAAAPAPELQMPEVFPYKDGMDHPELATNMVDGNTDTMWRSYEYDNNVFTSTNAITILLPFKESSTVTEIDVQMAEGTSGGTLKVLKVDDQANPRVGTELASTTLRSNTVITLDQPTEASAISLEFTSLPTDSKGVYRAWISEISVK